MEGAESIEKRELLKNFILSMIALDPQRRLDTKRLLQHQYLMAKDQTA
jgi:serine/threonine protein kinase